MCNWFISKREMTSLKMTVFGFFVVGILSTLLLYVKLISNLVILSPILSNSQRNVNITVQSTKRSKELMEIFNTKEVHDYGTPNSNIACNDSFKASHLMTIHSFEGRTGNHMFTLIMLLSSARRYCYTPVLKPSIHLDSIFDFRKSILKRSSNISTIFLEALLIYNDNQWCLIRQLKI